MADGLGPQPEPADGPDRGGRDVTARWKPTWLNSGLNGTRRDRHERSIDLSAALGGHMSAAV
jgi:hypothetical protein